MPASRLHPHQVRSVLSRRREASPLRVEAVGNGYRSGVAASHEVPERTAKRWLSTWRATGLLAYPEVGRYRKP